eukprot:358723-Chlamydomonas_euryale.AAC.10
MAHVQPRFCTHVCTYACMHACTRRQARPAPMGPLLQATWPSAAGVVQSVGRSKCAARLQTR